MIYNKFLYNFSHKDKKENKIDKCTFFKAINKCTSSIKLNKKNIVNWNRYYNHEINDIEAPMAKDKSEIKKKKKWR